MNSGTTPPSDALDALRAALGTQYTFDRELGRGGMGAVYLARDVTLDRPVAIKVISPDIAANATLRDRFLQEARTVARLRHPNIVPVYAAGEANGILYFAMEFVPGESLRDRMSREGRVAPDHCERILREVALALDHAHSQGLVHRDIKPENILLDADSGRAMLTDFGVARAFEQDGGLTQTGMILGSPRYMSPEQASGDRAIDGRSDIYSLALVGYEMFTGAPVVQASTAAAMMVKHLTETPAPLGEKVTGVPGHIAEAIDRGLAKDPDERWQTGSDFALALAAGTSARSASRAARGTHTRRSRRGPIIAATAAAAAAAAWFAFGRSSDEAAGSAYLVAPFEIQSGDASVRWLREGSVNMLTLTLGQWADLNVINYERTLSLLDAEGLGDKERLSLDDARALGRRANAGTVVTGQIQTTRDSLIVIARLYDVRSGRELQQAQEGTALGDDPRPLFDRLAQDLLAIAGGPTSTLRLAQATTTSIEAYRAYLDGVRLLNGWRLREADSAFVRAIALDSTFALAYHKRSLGLGWSEAGGTAYRESAERAVELAGRLPARERSLVEGHLHLANTINVTDTTLARTSFNAAVAAYQSVLERDSLVAEAWYGLADAYFHGRSIEPSVERQIEYTTRSLRAFIRTLEVDPTFHLAYAHLVQIHNDASRPGVLALLVGDSLVLFNSATIAERGGAAFEQSLRDSALARGLAIARAWVRSDVNSPQPYMQLAATYIAAQQNDSALAVVRDALSRPGLSSPSFRMMLLHMQLSFGDTGMDSTLAYVLDRFTADSIREIPTGERIALNGSMVAAAAAAGRASDVDRAIDLFIATDSTFPGSTFRTAQALSLYRPALRVAMGEPVTDAVRRQIAAAVRSFDTIPAPAGNQARAGSMSIPYLAFLATRDTVFYSALDRWAEGQYTELDALLALERGDTATAERIADSFPTPDALRNANVRFGVGGMRTVARAQVLAAVGRVRQAAETYEAYDVERINRNALAEPGYAVWVRSLLDRARLWRQLGERERAATAYEEFIRRWANAEGVAAAQVREARQELAALRDR